MIRSEVRNLDWAPAGGDKMDWVWAHMPVMNEIYKRFEKEKPFNGLRILVCLHLEAKTACLGTTLQAGGAQVVMVASNPLSTQDDVCAAMVKRGLTVLAQHGDDDQAYRACHERALSMEPDLIIDDGGDVVTLLHQQYPNLLSKVVGGCEETTTGLQRLRAMDRSGVLEIPMLAVNDAQMKFLFDNRYGTGQSVWESIMNTTNLIVAGKTVVVAGYGWCGKGTALRAKGLGAKVIITEIDPIKANEAWLDGFEVMPMDEAAPLGDVFITVTGVKGVVTGDHFKKMKNGTLLANAGHFDVEIDCAALRQMAGEERMLKPGIKAYTLEDGKQLHLLGEGRLVNLAAGNGHPAEVMDTSFAIQALGLEYLVKEKGKLKAGVYQVPEALDRQVAEIRLQALGLKIDCLSQAQEEYIQAWTIE